MAKTYGQSNDQIKDYPDFQNQVSSKLKIIGITKFSPMKIRNEFEKVTSVDDTVSILILKS